MIVLRWAGAACFALVIATGARAATLEQAHRLYFSGQPEQALQAYRSILNTQPSVEAALNGAAVAQELGRHREAISILEQARKSRLGGPGLLVQLAWARLNEGQVEAAKKIFDEAAGSGEKLEPVGALGLGMSQLETGQVSAAVDTLRTLVGEQPKMGLAHYMLGVALEAARSGSAAVDAYEQALKVDSHFVEVRIRLAPLLEKLKRYDDAWRHYVRSRNVFPTAAANSGAERLASRISKKPQEILPPRRIASHTPIPPVPEAATLPVVRVGIGTDEGGAPTPKKTLNFRIP